MAAHKDIQMTIDQTKNLIEYDDHVIFIYINQWENHSISKIQLAARQARNDLKQIFNKKLEHFTHLLTQNNKQLENTSTADINMSNWLEELKRLRDELFNLSTSIHLEHDKTESPIYLIKLLYKDSHELKSMNNNTDSNQINVPGTEPIKRSMLSSLTLKEQKQMLGERLFVLVQQIEPKYTAKITGMFLELDIKYILMLIQSNKLLREKIKEAVGLLEAHQYRQLHMTTSLPL